MTWSPPDIGTASAVPTPRRPAERSRTALRAVTARERAPNEGFLRKNSPVLSIASQADSGAGPAPAKRGNRRKLGLRREAQNAHGVRGKPVLEPPARECATVLANVHRTRVLERVDRRDVRAIDLGHGNLAYQC